MMPQDDEELEQQVEGDRGDHEEVDGDDVSGMRGEKGAPRGRRPRRRPVHVLGVSTSQLARATGVGLTLAREELGALTAGGVLRRIGTGRAVRYVRP